MNARIDALRAVADIEIDRAGIAEGAQDIEKVLNKKNEHLPKNLSTVADGEVVLQNGSDIVPQAIRWLWMFWLALGKLLILAGAPGQGKTTLALAFAATVTSKGRWPDGSQSAGGNVLIWSGEDDLEDTLMPRLIAMGADATKVYFIAGARIDGEIVPFDPARDLVQLTAVAEKVGGVKLLIVDPVVSAVAGDSHKNGEVRRALQPLVDLAARLDAAVLGISHFAKGGQGRDPTERVVGSVAFSAVARIVLVAAKVKNDDGEDRRLLARSKSNVGPDDGGFEYSIDQVELHAYPGVFASRVTWGQAVAGTARELLADAETEDADDGKRGARDSAEAFLRELLAVEPVLAKVVKSEAVEAGHAWATVRRAADDINVRRTKVGMTGPWQWSLAEGAQNSSKLPNKIDGHLHENLSTFGPAETDEELL